MKFENQYLTHKEYEELGGKIVEMPFNLLEYKVEKKDGVWKFVYPFINCTKTGKDNLVDDIIEEDEEE